MTIGIILAGGSGTRLWPISRAEFPKQFLSVMGKETMLQNTVMRLNSLGIDEFVVICNEMHRFIVAEQLREIGKKCDILLEPVGRSTAPAVALAALTLKNKKNSKLLVVPTDHVIYDMESFTETMLSAISFVEKEKLVTFGVNVANVNINYGYIKKGKKLGNSYKVDKFIEKPSESDAELYFKSEEYFWNSGIFLFEAATYLEELNLLCPLIFKRCKDSVRQIKTDGDFIRVNKEAYELCSSLSIDRGIMEKTDKGVVFPLKSGWKDIGTWESFISCLNKDPDGNCSQGHVIMRNVKDSYIRTEGKLAVALGIENLIVVDTKDAILISKKECTKSLTAVVDTLKNNLRSEWHSNLDVYRPWGKFEIIDKGDGFQVKKLSIKSGAKLSLQKHNFRSEHWVLVSGIAQVTKGKEQYVVKQNESVYVPIGTLHSIENIGNETLKVIEVQSGSYLDEDDIERFEDMYGRY